MSSVNKNKILYVSAIIIIVVVFCIWFFGLPVASSKLPTLENAQTSENFKTIQIGGVVIKAELATTQAQQIQGLSDRASLASSTGMFFVFNNPSEWGIWMKDMNFPIDVLWISDDLKVVYIVENMSPASYPTVYKSNTPSQYVLEVPAGTVKDYSIAVGQDVTVR